MVGFYPLCAFGENRVAASIDTALHAFLPFPHVDHLHPDWAIALAASANGAEKLEEFNRQYGRSIAWVPWQRPGLRAGADAAARRSRTPGLRRHHPRRTRPVHLGHDPARVLCEQHHDHRSDGGFIQAHARRANRPGFGGAAITGGRAGSRVAIAEIFPHLRGAVSSNRRVDRPLRRVGGPSTFANSTVGRGALRPRHELSGSFPPHAHLADVHSVGSGEGGHRCAARADRRAHRAVPRRLRGVLQGVRGAGVAGAARQQSVGRRDSRPRPVRLRQGQARSADHDRILRERHPRDAGGERAGGATARPAKVLPQVRRPEQAKEFKTFHNYVALPRLEAFRIEYWALEEAKLQRMPPEKEFSRKVVVVVGGGSGIGREVALQIAQRGGHVVVADANARRRGRRRRGKRRRCRRRRWCSRRRSI